MSITTGLFSYKEFPTITVNYCLFTPCTPCIVIKGKRFFMPKLRVSRLKMFFDLKIVYGAMIELDVYSSSSSFLACNSRLRSAIRRHHPPQRAVLSQICCFGERKVVLFQILLDGAEPCDAGTT